MRKFPCQYAIIKFAPFVETGEFANVGILVFSAIDCVFEFKLQTKRYTRITGFFNELDKGTYLSAMKGIEEELTRCKTLLELEVFGNRHKDKDVEYANILFQEIIKTRETIVQFSAPRKMTTGNAPQAVSELFDYYVERDFIDKKSPEQFLENRVRKSLAEAELVDRFKSVTLGNNSYQATFPFVEKRNGHPYKIIKPLYLAHKTPHMILDHCAQWHFRATELRRRNVLPKRVLFSVEGPKKNNYSSSEYSSATEMFTDAVDMLRNNRFDVILANEINQLVEFAR